MNEAYVCQDCGDVVEHANAPHDYKDCQIVKLRQSLREREARIEALEKEPAGLGPLDAGLILLADGGQSVLLPKMDDDQDVPGHVILLTALAARLTDKSFADDCLEWLAEYVKRTKLLDTALRREEER